MGLLDKIQVTVNSIQSDSGISSIYNTIVIKQKQVITQEDFPYTNTKYIIKWNYDLLESSITIPENCLIQFDGGSISNGILIGNDTIIVSYQEDEIIFNNVDLMGTFRKSNINELGISAEELTLGEDEEFIQSYKTITINLGEKSVSFNTIVVEKHQIEYYIVTLDTLGGNNIQPIRVRKGDSIQIPVPTRSEYIFDGWYSNLEFTGNTFSGLYTPNSDITLYAKWHIVEYELVYNLNYPGGGIFKSISIPSGSTVDLSSTVNRTGYTFIGWNTQADDSGINYSPGASFTITKDTTLYAKWQINTYTITLNPNHDNEPNLTISATYGSNLNQLNYPTLSRTGYTQTSWNISSDGSGTNPEIVTENITLYAQWVRNVPDTLTMYSFRTPQQNNYTTNAVRTTTLIRDTNTLIETSLRYHYIPVITPIQITKQEWGANGIVPVVLGTYEYDSVNGVYIYKIEDNNLIGEEIKYN